jgi:Ca2+-binding EF-hand superfamily protein
MHLNKVVWPLFLLVVGVTVADEPEEILRGLDKNKDGCLQAKEIQPEHRRLFRRLLRTADTNHDTQLTFREFQAGTALPTPALDQHSPPMPTSDGGANRLHQFFDRFDVDATGKIAYQDLPGRWAQRLEHLDQNRDGFLARTELKPPAVLQSRKIRDSGDRNQKAERFGRTFNRMDENQDGILTKDEVPEDRLHQFNRSFAGRDQGENNSLTKSQFVKAMTREHAKGRNYLRKKSSQSRPVESKQRGRTTRRLFRQGLIHILDKDRNNELSTEEISAAPSELLHFDRNTDGALSTGELLSIRPGATADASRFISRPRRTGKRPVTRRPEFR